jgi:hypothetical protein
MSRDLLAAVVDVHDRAAVGEGVPEALDLLLERALGADQRVVDLRVAAVDRERDLGEAGVEAAPEELRVREHPAVGHGLDLRVPRRAPELDEPDVVGVNGRLAAREDEPRGSLVAPVEDLRLDRLALAVGAVVGVGVQAEHAAIVAAVGQPHPVALVVRGLLVLDHLGGWLRRWPGRPLRRRSVHRGPRVARPWYRRRR